MNTEESQEIKTPLKLRKSRAKPKKMPIIAEVENTTPIEMVEMVEMVETTESQYEPEQHDMYDPLFLSNLNNYEENIHDEIPEKKPRKTRAKKTVDTEQTALYGKNKLVLIKRIEQYKLLFPQLSNFKYSREQDEPELEAILVEFQSLIEVSSEDSFIEETIFQSIKMCEGYSAKTRYDLSGLSLVLKHNKQFTDILKILHLKYATYLSIPPEIQCCLIISCSVAIVLNKNQNKTQRDSYLDEPINF